MVIIHHALIIRHLRRIYMLSEYLNGCAVVSDLHQKVVYMLIEQKGGNSARFDERLLVANLATNAVETRHHISLRGDIDRVAPLEEVMVELLSGDEHLLRGNPRGTRGDYGQ